MTNRRALIVFVKNAKLGHAKTRLAASIGDQAAFDVYLHLMKITERATQAVQDTDLLIYFSSELSNDWWSNESCFVQTGNDLGERMQNAFEDAFKMGYDQVIGVGSDLPDLNEHVIHQAFDELNEHDAVFGPSDDGGYYLIGMCKLQRSFFEDKSWSTESLMDETRAAMDADELEWAELPILNDIDTIEDLKQSSIANELLALIAESKS